METIAQEAKRLLKDIPDGAWVTGHRIDEEGRCCMIGHWNRRHGVEAKNTRFSKQFERHIEEFVSLKHGFECNAFDINDGFLAPYQQRTAKKRVMALFNDMIKEGY